MINGAVMNNKGISYVDYNCWWS